MPSAKEVRAALDKDELDYGALARELGEDALPQLQELVAEDDPRIASKAAYLAALIGGTSSDDILATAAHSRHDVVRVSAAAALSTLPAGRGKRVAELLLADPDAGVRARAMRSAVQLDDSELTRSVEEMARQDDDPAVRNLATRLTGDPPEAQP